MNDLNKIHFDNFPKDSFEIFINCLENQGYVIDGKEEQGVVFSTTQLDNMTEEVFYALINKFNIQTSINFEEEISSTGFYHNEHGGYSIIYNFKILDYDEAKQTLNDYLNSF